MDTRAIITGTLAAIATICATILAAINRDTDVVFACYALASTCAGYVVGLYSEPVQKASSVIDDETNGATDEA